MKDYVEAARTYLATCEWSGLDYGRDAGCDEGLGGRYLVIEHTDDNDDAYYLTFDSLDEIARHLADLVADEWGVTEIVDLETGERVRWHVEVRLGEASTSADVGTSGARAALKVAAGIVQQHNLLSTATDDDRLATLVRLLHWWNHVALPVLRRVEGSDPAALAAERASALLDTEVEARLSGGGGDWVEE